MVEKSWAYRLAFTGAKRMSVPSSFQKFGVAVQILRIAVKVFGGTELSWVYEDRYNNNLAFVSCLSNQSQMPFMKVSHRGYEPDPFSLPGETRRQDAAFLSGRK